MGVCVSSPDDAMSELGVDLGLWSHKQKPVRINPPRIFIPVQIARLRNDSSLSPEQHSQQSIVTNSPLPAVVELDLNTAIEGQEL